MSEHVVPALRLDISRPLSPDEFQRQLYAYFEEKGILSDLKAHLRAHMVIALKDTKLGKELVGTKRDISPKLQALNLLIAEYLLKKDYHYSLSVFSTEVPLNNIFPAFSTGSKDGFQFSENDMWDILETLGFLQPSEQAKAIAKEYRKSEASLINCIIKSSKGDKEDFEITKCAFKIESSHEISLENFVIFLREIGISPRFSLQIIEQLRNVISVEIDTIRKEKDDQVIKIKSKLETEANKKLEKYKRKLFDMEHVFEKERQRLEYELEHAKSNLKECAQSLQYKYKNIHKMEDQLKSKEKHLKGQAEIIHEKEKMLQKHLEDAVVEKLNYREMKEKLDHITLNTERTLQKKVQVEDKSLQTTENVNIENVLLRQNVHQMQLQIDNLREQNANYLNRIQELALRTNTLMRELQDTHQRPQGSSFVPLVVPSVPTLTFRSNYGIPSYNGGGEEGNKGQSLTPRHYRYNQAIKKRTTNQQVPNQSTTSSDEVSPTEQVLREAKQRLHDLEKESNQIDQHYKECTSKKQKGIIGDFQANLDCICQSITRLFNKERHKMAADPGAGPSSATLPYMRTSTLLSDYDSVKENLKVTNLIADLPLNITNENYDQIMNSLGINQDGTSANSSVLNLADQSLSSIDEAKLKSDPEDQLEAIDPDDSGKSC